MAKRRLPIHPPALPMRPATVVPRRPPLRPVYLRHLYAWIATSHAAVEYVPVVCERGGPFVSLVGTSIDEMAELRPLAQAYRDQTGERMRLARFQIIPDELEELP